MTPQPADHELVARARSGDAAAFDELVRRTQDRAWTLARGILRDPEAAADAVQEAYVKAWRTIGRFRGDAAFTTWLHRIVVNACRDMARKRVPVPVDTSGAPGGAAHDDQARGAAAAGAGAVVADPVDVHAQHLQRSELLEAIAALDEGFREAVLLVDVLGASVEEAAAALEVAPGTVKSRCFRGRAALARTLGTRGLDPTSTGGGTER